MNRKGRIAVTIMFAALLPTGQAAAHTLDATKVGFFTVILHQLFGFHHWLPVSLAAVGIAGIIFTALRFYRRGCD